MDLWIDIGPNDRVLKSEIIAFQDGGYGCFEITVRSGRAHPISVRAEHAATARRNVMLSFGMDMETKASPKKMLPLDKMVEKYMKDFPIKEIKIVQTPLTEEPSTCDCGSPMCKYPNSPHCRRPL